MRTTLLMLLLVGCAALAAAQTPPPAFGYFHCLCRPGSPMLVPTPNVFSSQPAVASWTGTAYALSASEAQFKAKNACLAENRGSQSICDTCGCAK